MSQPSHRHRMAQVELAIAAMRPYATEAINEALETGEGDLDVLRSWFDAFVSPDTEGWVWDANIDNVLSAYVKCALWAESAYATVDDDGKMHHDENADQNFDALNFDINDVTPEALASMREDVESFLTINAGDLLGLTLTMIGHNFWLTRNHHGTGFWDRDLGERGDRLTQAAHAYGESNLLLSNDGTIDVT
jgi:hypothetical protein